MTNDPPTEVQLMGTCLCDAFFPEALQATVRVLEHLGVTVRYPEDQTCCGQPAFNSGDWKASRQVARHAARVFAGDLPVVVPSGSCAAMHTHGNPLQFENEDDLAAVQDLASRTFELADFIHHELGLAAWPGRLQARAAFHHSCHTRGSRTRAAAAALLGSIDGLELLEFGQDDDQCCGFGGTFSVTFPHVSKEMGALKLDRLLGKEPDFLVSADLSCLMHLGGLAERQGRPAIPRRHLAEVLLQSLENAQG